MNAYNSAILPLHSGRATTRLCGLTLCGILLWIAALTPHVVAADRYAVRPGDKVIITVFQEDDLTTEVLVPASGEIEFPLIGTVQLAGRPVKESVAEITKRLANGLVVDPKVVLTVSVGTLQTATVMGQVGKPGLVELPSGAKLDVLAAIAITGGFTEKANLRSVTVRRQIGEESRLFRIDAERMATDDKAKSFMLEPRDVVIVEELLPRSVTVMGEVEKPGRIELPRKEQLDLLDVIAVAGGYTDTANSKRVTVRRQSEGGEKLYRINAKKLAEDPAAKPFIVEPDDVVTVSERFFLTTQGNYGANSSIRRIIEQP